MQKIFARTVFLVVRFDPLGTWESDGDIGAFGFQQYEDDINTILRFVIREYGTLPITLIGHSMGGMVSVAFAIEYPHLIEKVVGIMCPLSRDILETKTEWRKSGFRISKRSHPKKDTEIIYQVPYKIVEEIYSQRVDLTHIMCPILLIAGQKDTKVPPVLIENYFKKIKRNKKFVILKGVQHDYRKHEDQIRLVNDAVITWLEG
ncbi:alpha/beta hydrolase [Candidatus Nomurabacteria bacterium]|nr:alpha/beta hydrolase [Candidatus Nomurabacteria bacterium]